MSKKIKNPDLYIKRLKKQIADLKEWRKMDEMGRRHEINKMNKEKATLEDRIQLAHQILKSGKIE